MQDLMVSFVEHSSYLTLKASDNILFYFDKKISKTISLPPGTYIKMKLHNEPHVVIAQFVAGTPIFFEFYMRPMIW